MNKSVVPSEKIKEHYNEVMGNLKGDYIYYRWGESEIKRRHYRQTETVLKYLLDKIKVRGDILEIGCGPAVWTPLFTNYVNSVTLLDISEEALSQARKRLVGQSNINYICGDFVDVELCEEKKYDMIISIRAFEYMSDKLKVVKKCYDLLKPGGHLIIATKNRGWIDHAKDLKRFKNTSINTMPIGVTMQMDLMNWHDLMEIYRITGFKEVFTYPVVFGSYSQPFRSKPGLILCDLIHKYCHKYSIAKWQNILVESFLTIGVKK